MTDLRLLMRVSILCGGSEDFVTGGVAEIQSVPLLPTLQYKSTPGSKGSQRLAINIPQVPLQAVQEQLGELLTTEQIDALLMGAALTVRPAQSGDATWVSNSEGTTKYDKTAGGQYAEYDGPNIWVNQPIHERVFILGATTGKYRQSGPLTMPVVHNMIGGEIKCDIIRVYNIHDYSYPSGLVNIDNLPATDIELFSSSIVLRDFERYYYLMASYTDIFGVKFSAGVTRVMLTKFLDVSADWNIAALLSDGTTLLGEKSGTTYSAKNIIFNSNSLRITPTAPITCRKIRVNIQRSSTETMYEFDATTYLSLNTVDTTHNVSTAVKHAAKLYGLNFDITLTLSSAYTLIPGQDTLELVMNNNAGEAGPSGSITSIEYLP